MVLLRLASFDVFRYTLRGPVSVSGRGLHTGTDCEIRLSPAPTEHGIVFRRSGTRISASPLSVRSTARGTFVGAGPAEVATVEHLLAALSALDVADVLIDVDGPEIPAIDGSAAPFVDLIESAGRTAHGDRLPRWTIRSKITVADGSRSVRLEPSARRVLSASVDFPATGPQSVLVDIEDGRFSTRIAWARTFGFVAEADELRRAGRALGAGLDCALVYGSGGVVNPEGARGPDEVVRHKVLDAIGDLGLCGAGFRYRYVGRMPSHALNVRAAARALELFEPLPGAGD